MSRWVDIIVIVLIALGALAVSVVVALYFIGPTRIAGGEAREYFLTFNAPPCTTTTEANAAYTGAPRRRAKRPPLGHRSPYCRLSRSGPSDDETQFT